MAITYVSSGSAASTSLTMPTHQAGDLIVFSAFNDASSTVPTVPSGWVLRVSNGSLRAMVTAYKHATSSAEVSGTWTNATHVACGVYRSDAGKHLIVGTGNSQAATSTTIQYFSVMSSIGMISGGAGGVWFVAFAGTAADYTADTAPTGMVFRTNAVGTGEIAMHDTNGPVSSFSSASVATTSVAYRTHVFEIYETSIDIASGGSGGVPLIGAGGLVY